MRRLTRRWPRIQQPPPPSALPVAWGVLQEAAGTECERSLGPSEGARGVTYCEPGGPPPGWRASVLESCPVPCTVASPGVLRGRFTLHWTRLSRLVPCRWTKPWTSGMGRDRWAGMRPAAPSGLPGAGRPWVGALSLAWSSRTTRSEQGRGAGRGQGQWAPRGLCSAGTVVGLPAFPRPPASRNILAPGPVPPPTFTAQSAPRRVTFMEISCRSRKRPIAH